MRHEALQWAEARRVRAQLEAGDDPLPRHVEIHPTDRCNHRCAFCFHGGAGHPAAPGALLTVAQYRQLFTELAALGIFDLSISGGGEPTLSLPYPSGRPVP